MKISALLCVIATSVRFVMAQEVPVTGIVKDIETHQPISFCNVRVMNAGLGTAANSNGSFTLTIPDSLSRSVLIFSSLGYRSDSITITRGVNHYSIFLATSQSTLDEIVITGIAPVTFKENPISITTISSARIDRTVESNIIDVLVKNVPGLNAVKTGPNISKPFIRGLGYNRVLILYDGVRQEGQQWGDEHGIEVDPYTVDRAEVIKGPASLMYGSDALAGVVSFFPFIPKKNDHVTGRFISEYQGNNGLLGSGLRLGYAGDHWIWSCSGSYRIAKNYRNDIDGYVYNTGFKEKNVAASLRYKTDKLNLNLNFTVYDNLQGIPDGSRDSITRKFTKQIYEGSKDDIKQRPVVSKNELDTYALSPLHQHIQHYRWYSNSAYQVGGGNVHALLGLQQSVRREYNHPTDPVQAGLFVRLNTLNYGLRYDAPQLSNIDISAGINGMLQDNKNKNGTDFPIPDFNLYDIGAYGFIKWKHDKLTVSGGGRYDKRYVTSPDFYVQPNIDNGFVRQATNADAVDAILQFPSLHQTFHGVSLSAGATYAVNQSISLKANVARGYRAPNISEIASNGLDPGAHIVYLGNRNFVPEFSFQQDLGVYADFDNVVASVSIFNNFLQHYIFLSQLIDEHGKPLELVQGNKTFQYQQASAQLYGMEATFDFRPKTIKGFNFATNMSAVYGNNTSKQFDGKGIEGQYLPFIPPLKILSSLSQNFNLRRNVVPFVNIKMEIDFNASQNRYMALYHTETRTGHYTLFNASCNFDFNYIKKAPMQIQFQINNVFDIVYQSNLSRLKYFEYYSQSPNGMLGMHGMGRNVCVKVNFLF